MFASARSCVFCWLFGGAPRARHAGGGVCVTPPVRSDRSWWRRPPTLTGLRRARKKRENTRRARERKNDTTHGCEKRESNQKKKDPRNGRGRGRGRRSVSHLALGARVALEHGLELLARGLGVARDLARGLELARLDRGAVLERVAEHDLGPPEPLARRVARRRAAPPQSLETTRAAAVAPQHAPRGACVPRESRVERRSVGCDGMSDSGRERAAAAVRVMIRRSIGRTRLDRADVAREVAERVLGVELGLGRARLLEQRLGVACLLRRDRRDARALGRRDERLVVARAVRRRRRRQRQRRRWGGATRRC